MNKIYAFIRNLIVPGVPVDTMNYRLLKFIPASREQFENLKGLVGPEFAEKLVRAALAAPLPEQPNAIPECGIDLIVTVPKGRAPVHLPFMDERMNFSKD